jgi:hypothetical protein
MSVGLSSLSVLVGLALGVGLRLLAERLLGDVPRAAVLWSVELALALVFGALTGLLLAENAQLFAATGGALGLSLTAYAVTSGALALLRRNPRRRRSPLIALAHFIAASAAACIGLLLVIALSQAG